MTTRVGILGGGNISETHARAACEIPNVALVAHWSRNPVHAARFAREFGGSAFDTLGDFVAHGGMDIALVGTPSGLHGEHATAAATRGIHVLVEKPLDISSRRVDALIETCERAGVALGVFYQDRTAPQLAWLKQLVDRGDLGTLLLVSARVKWYRPPEYYAESSWRGSPALAGGGALMNQGTHTVDLVLWLTGDVGRVGGSARSALHHIDVEDTAVATLELTNGAVGMIEATTAAFPGFPRRVELTGTEGTAIIDGDRVISVQLRRGRLEPPPQEDNTNPSTSSPVISDIAGHRRVIEDFIDAIANRRRPLCDGREGRRSVALVEAIYESARTGARVSIVNPDIPHLATT